MKVEQYFFIQILRDHIHGNDSAPAEDPIDWKKMGEYAEEQALSGLVYVQTKSYFKQHPEIAPDVADKLHKGFYSDVYLSVNRNAELNAIARRFGEIPMVLMKGSLVREYYPVPELRSMGDIDIVIHTEHRQQTDVAMLSEGYNKFVDNHAVWTYDKNSIEFEIHDHMFYEYLSNDIDYRGYFDQVWDHAYLLDGSKNMYIVDESFHFLYLITHMAKHITNKGMGFRSFLDLVFLCQKAGRRMDWGRIQAELESLKLLNFTKTCFALCERWFAVTMPLESAPLEENFYEAVTEKMFCDGIFGLENEQNEAAHSAKEIKRSSKPYWQAAIGMMIHHLFPPYRDIQLIPWYSFVDGRPWLLPAAWVYRWFYTATHKFRDSKDLLLEPIAKRSVIERREQLIRDWGL